MAEVESKQAQLFLAQSNYRFVDLAERWDFISSVNGHSIALSGLANNDLLVTNLAAALQAFLLVFPQQFESEAINRAFQKLQFIGRFQYLSKEPAVIVDVAHNPDSAKVLNQKVLQLKSRGYKRIHAICGMLKDKDIASSLAHCADIDQWYCIDLPGPRGAKGRELVEKLPENARKGAKSYQLLVDALEEYWQHQQQGDALIVFGSFVTVGLMLEWWEQNNEKVNEA